MVAQFTGILRHWGNKRQRDVFCKNIEAKCFSEEILRQKVSYNIQNYAKINFVPFGCILRNFQVLLKICQNSNFLDFVL